MLVTVRDTSLDIPEQTGLDVTRSIETQFLHAKVQNSRSRLPSRLRCGSETARLLELRVHIPPGIVSCQVKVSAAGRSLVHRSLTECCVPECDLEISLRRPRPTRAVQP